MDNNQWNYDDDMRKQMEEAKKAFHKKYPEIDLENRGKYGWLMMVPFLLVFALQFALMFMGFEFLFTWEAAHFTGNTYLEFVGQIYEILGGTTFNLVISLLYASFVSVGFTIWYRKKILPGRRKKASVWKKNPLLLAVGIVCVCIGAQYVTTYLMNALAVMFPSWMILYQQLMEGIGLNTDTGAVSGLVVLYSVILGPIAEELTFRGITLGYGRRAMSFWAANISQALLFALLHANPLQSTYTFVVGLLLGYIAWKSDSLVLAIVVHMGFNFVGVIAPKVIVMGTSPVSFFLFLLLGMLLTYVGLECISRCGGQWDDKEQTA